MLEVKLVVVGGNAKSSEVRLKLPTIIGRGKEAGLTVPHALVSRRHTEVFERDGKLFVRDLGSLNGTFVNNLKIDGEQALGPNQLLTLGNITFRAVYEVEAGSLESTENSETVSFDDVKTQEQPRKEAKKTASKGSAKPVDFNETVPVDEFGGDSNNPIPKAAPIAAAIAQPAVKPEQAESLDQVELDEASQGSPASDTDKSFKSDGSPSEKEESISSIFSFDENEGVENSIAVSALGDLPSSAQSAISFVGNVDVGDAAKPAASQIDSLDIDLGGEKKSSPDEDDDPSLGSFLRKIPR